MSRKYSVHGIILILFSTSAFAQKANDVTAPLHASKPDYPIPYIIPSVPQVKTVLDRVYHYLDSVTPFQFVNRKTGETVSSLNNIDTNTIFKQGDFRLTSYEWGVTYSGMLRIAETTGDNKYTDYTRNRMHFIANSFDVFNALHKQYPNRSNPLRQPIDPRALDDAGAMCAAMIKTLRSGGQDNLRAVIDRYINYISTKEFRFPDGTLARNRPQKNTLWLDDLYMAVPALSQMGKLTGDIKYFNDAVKQVLQFSKRMFDKEKNVYIHGWVEEMTVHPAIYWARANGWALMAMTELLDVLPQTHPGRKQVLEQFKLHVKGLATFQSGQGFWHQLLNRTDSYLETSATAIYTYCIARAINNGWIDRKAYASMCLLAWNAVTTKVNAQGQVEGTCVGTGMAFDPAFYYYRPVNVFAAHGYGPVLLAGAEIIAMLNKFVFEINDSAIQLKSDSLPVMETGGQRMPEQWIDKDTRHKVVRLSRIEGNSSLSFYFHNNPFTGNKMVYYSRSGTGNRQLYLLDLASLKSEQLTAHPAAMNGEIVHKKNGDIYYQVQDSVFCANANTKKTQLVYVFPDDFKANISTVNADGTLLAGAKVDDKEKELLKKYPDKKDYFNIIFEAKMPRTLFTVNVKTKQLEKIFTDSAWLNHIQFSPTDPALLMFCHEGPWHKLDRIWTINIKTKNVRLMHKRTMDMEIAGHEWISHDGKTIWFDLQQPKGETFFLAGADMKTGKEIKYSLKRDEWSIHFNQSPDQKLFAGDGGDPGQVAKAANGQWIYLFKPDGDHLVSTKLVNMKNHQYRLEPNVHFSPDGKWVIFRANFEGIENVYAVEVVTDQATQSGQINNNRNH